MIVTVYLKSGKEVAFPTSRVSVYYKVQRDENGEPVLDEKGRQISTGKIEYLDYAKADRKLKLIYNDPDEIAAVTSEPDPPKVRTPRDKTAVLS